MHNLLTGILENSFHIKSISGASFIVRTPLQISSQFAGSRVINNPWIVFADSILSADQNQWNLGRIPKVGHLREVAVDGVERRLVLEAEDEDDGVHPGGKLHLWRATLVPDEQQVRRAVHQDLLLEAAALGRLLLHVGAGEVAVHQGGLARRQRADNAEPQVGHAARQRPFLAVDERVFNADDVIPDLLCNQLIGHKLNQIINCVDRRMNTLETLNFLPNGQRVVDETLQMRSGIHGYDNQMRITTHDLSQAK